MNTSTLVVAEPSREFPLAWKPVDSTKLRDLPAPWPTLRNSMSPLLYERVARFWTVAHEDGKEKFLVGPLVVLGESFLNARKPIQVPNVRTNESFNAQKWECACRQLHVTFPDIPPLLWETIASLGNRPNPTVETSIINVQDDLPFAWGICDAALHALGKSYGLFFHVQNELKDRTGHVLLHGCGCDHVVAAFRKSEGSFPKIPDDRAREFKVAKEWLDHFLSELYLIFVVGLPFRMNPEDFNSTKIVSLK